MKGPESKIVDCIRAYLRSRPHTWHFKVGVAGWQVSGLPDLIGCADGRFFAFEVKRPGREATPLQGATLRAIQRANGLAETVTSLDQVKFLLEGVTHGS